MDLKDNNGKKNLEEISLKKIKLQLKEQNDLNYLASNQIPQDKFYIVYIILIIHGIGTLIPWNMFITARSYYTDYKLNVTLKDDTQNATLEHLRKNFLSYLGFSAQLPNLICNIINLLMHKSGHGLTTRIVTSIIIELAIVFFTIILSIVDTSSWPIVFFYITIISVTIVYMATGVYHNSIFGLAAHLPKSYTNAVVIGSNISGTLTSVINILSIVISPNFKIAAIFYFLVAFLILLIGLISYLLLPLNKFYRYWDKAQVQAQAQAIENNESLHFKHIFATLWTQCLNIFFLFFVTLAVFPAVIASIEPFDNAFNISYIYFSPIFCYLVFNLSAMIGNLLPSFIWHPGINYLWIAICFRFVFIPFFLFCNFNPSTRVWPVIFKSDYYLLIGCLILGLSSGYFSSLILMESPKIIQNKKYFASAGMMIAFFLILGIFCGINVPFLLTWLVEQPFFKLN